MPYFVRERTIFANKYIEGDIVKMLKFLIDNIFVEFVSEFFNRQFAFQWAPIVRQY